MVNPKSVFIVFPNQLYNDISTIKEINPNIIYVIEEPVYFYDKQYKPFKPHKLKVAYLRACMKAYFDTIKKEFPRKCKYIEYHTLQHENNDGYKFLSNCKKVSFYDPLDVELIGKMQKIVSTNILNVIESPDLLLPNETIDEYYKDKINNKVPKHASFYEFVKTKLNVLDGVKNLDTMNRSPPPKAEPNVYHFIPSRDTSKYYIEAISYTNKNFIDHYGECELLQTFPITTKDAERSFERFLEKSLLNFGKYEDAVMQNDPFMYHSVISPMLNVGILSPKYVLDKTLAFYNENTPELEIPLSSLEGFLRQVIGWRFFMQTLYIKKHDELVSSNLPENSMTFKNPEAWYNGTTGILPIDEEIKKIRKYGYAHHIVRLMIIMNFFILCNIHPHEIYRWFMEVISMDAYSWVMISNIYAMGYFYPKVMSKPYISTSNYIVKMTNYKKDGHWDKIWNALYHNFVKNKPNSYTFFYKRTLKDDTNLHKFANQFIETHFVKYNDN